jgi:hypothetical protein
MARLVGIVSTLATLESDIACAGPHDEAHLFANALALILPDPQLRRACAARAFADAAILIHRALLPTHAFQLGETPSKRGLASTWRKGDAHTLPFDAATPGLALLRATVNATLRKHEAETRAQCTRCRGRGWIITRDGGKRICIHECKSSDANISAMQERRSS